MSHSTTLVALEPTRPKLTQKMIKDALAEALEPFSENRQVLKHDTQCSCVGRKAEQEVLEEVSKKLNPLRDSFHARADIKALNAIQSRVEAKARKLKSWKDLPKKDQEAHEKAEEKSRSTWEEHIRLVERNKLEKKLLAKHPGKTKPDPECSSCKGSGKYETDRNPDSKWDWYEVGGRWEGYLSEGLPPRYRVLGDPNIMTGAGVKLRLRTDKGFSTFAVLWDGQWSERGEMGWFGMASNEKPKDTWGEEFSRLVTALNDDAVCVLVDVHI